MAIRLYCDIEGLEDNWLEVKEVWSRAEWREYVQAGEEAFWVLWPQKVTACNIVTLSGDVVNDPAAINEELLDRIDLRLVSFISAGVNRACAYLQSLGNAQARLSSNGNGRQETVAQRRNES